MQYIHSLPAGPSFKGTGLSGYAFGPLKQDLDVYYVEVESGHDTFMISKKIARTYYVLHGSGYFTIAGTKYDVGPGMLVEVPARVEYSYSGKMELIIFSRPRWSPGIDSHTKWNPDVVTDPTPLPRDRPWLARLIRLRPFGKSPVGAYLRFNQQLWNCLPQRAAASGLVRTYGEFLHRLARAHGGRAQAGSTFFLRNRPMLELIERVARRRIKTDVLRVVVLGSSTGAEVYSVAWKIRSARPDLKLILHAVDISSEAVNMGRQGIYSLTPRAGMFERMSNDEIKEMFEKNGNEVVIRTWLREGIEWHVADVRDVAIRDLLGPQDIVIASNFLCHMEDSMAERCLRNLATLVTSGGYLLVSGVDLDVRSRVASELGWSPVRELLEEIHEGDPCLRRLWPCHYGALEPLQRARDDWMRRYAAAFQVGAHVGTGQSFAVGSCQYADRVGVGADQKCDAKILESEE
jgi:hypothetical protein